MGLFPAVKKLYHFEIPMGYCYSPFNESIMCVCELYWDYTYPRKESASSYDVRNIFYDFEQQIMHTFYMIFPYEFNTGDFFLTWKGDFSKVLMNMSSNMR